jgi:hypothetical protein
LQISNSRFHEVYKRKVERGRNVHNAS